jgi:hypothetical protein
MTKEIKAVDILGFDAVSESEAGIALAMKNTDGTDTGVKFTVLGKHSDVVQVWSKKVFAKMQREESMAKKRGKELDVDIDELRDQTREGAAIRVTGWEGVTQTFDKDLLRQVLTKNPHWIDAILEASNDDALFTKAS